MDSTIISIRYFLNVFTRQLEFIADKLRVAHGKKKRVKVNGVKSQPSYASSSDYSEAVPLGSKGKRRAISPETMNNAPEIKIGTEVVRLAYNATMGDMIPKTRLAAAVMALPVPRTLVGKSSGVIA